MTLSPSLAERLAARFTASSSYGALLASLSLSEAATALGLRLIEVQSARDVARAWVSAGRGVLGHAAKDRLLASLRTAADVDDDAPVAKPKPSFVRNVDETVPGVSLNDAMSEAGIPSSGVEWKLANAGKDIGSTWKGYQILVGQHGDKLLLAAFYFMPRHTNVYQTDPRDPKTQKTRVVDEVWEARMAVVPKGKDLAKTFAAAATAAKLTLGRLWQVWPAHGLSAASLKKLERVKGGISLKEALIGADMLKVPEVLKSAPQVELMFKANRLKGIWDTIDDTSMGEDSWNRGSLDPYHGFKRMDVVCRINGKDYKLDPQTLLDPKFLNIISAARNRDLIKDGGVFNLTRSKSYSPLYLISNLLDSLTGEPTALILALSRAHEWFEDKENASKPRFAKTVLGHPFRLAALLPRLTAAEVADLTCLSLSAVLSFEAPHVA